MQFFSKNKKIGKIIALLWLMVTIIPIVLLPLSFVLMSTNDLDLPPDSPTQDLDLLFNFGMAINAVIYIMAFTYIAYMFLTPYVPSGKRALWLVILLFVNIIAMPFFWYWYVWLPSSNPDNFQSEPIQKKSILIPILIGLLLIAIIPIVTIYEGYKVGHAYEYLADSYPLKNNDVYTQIASGGFSISKRRDKGKGMSAIFLPDSLKVYTGNSGIKFAPTKIKKYMYRSFEVPNEKIHSCSKQCGGSTDYILILDEANTEISIDDAPELIEWCWNNKIPILSSNARREWLYSGANLPEISELNQTLYDKKTYNYHAKQACLGY